MAIGSSAPELAATVVGVFVTRSDIETSRVIGSAMFNLLVICGGVARREPASPSPWAWL
jgi:Ca2+/Na+ antiporter